jgi:hypothetical protein
MRAQGCVCAVDVVFGSPTHPLAGRLPGEVAVQLRHDDWCPMLRTMQERPPGTARGQVLLIPNLEAFGGPKP